MCDENIWNSAMIGFRFDPATCTAMGAKAEATVVHHVADKTHTWKEALGQP